MKVYISASFKSVGNMVEIEQLRSFVKKSGFEDFLFYLRYRKLQKDI